MKNGIYFPDANYGANVIVINDHRRECRHRKTEDPQPYTVCMGPLMLVGGGKKVNILQSQGLRGQ